MCYQIQRRVRWIAIFSIITSVVTIVLAQITIVVKRTITVQNEYNISLSIKSEEILNAKEECDAILNSNFDLIDITLVVVTLFSLILDLPANVMLLVAVNTSDKWKFIPWLIVTGSKLIGCVVITCLLVYLTFDDSFENSSFYPTTDYEKRLPINQRIFSKM